MTMDFLIDLIQKINKTISDKHFQLTNKLKRVFYEDLSFISGKEEPLGIV